MLFLGAGANYGATHPEGEAIPVSGEQLANFLCERFFNGELRDRSLLDIAKFIVSEFGISALHDAIGEKFDGFKPAKYHNLICHFAWHAIATTNYDQIVEKAFKEENKADDLLPIYKDGDGLDLKLKGKPNAIPYLKLHGCISRSHDTETPLILTPEQYLRYIEHRRRLFDAFRGWAHDFTVVFAGYSIGDPHIQQVLMDLEDNNISRPRFYSIDPYASDYDVRYWGERRVEIVKCTFSSFLQGLDSEIPRAASGLAAVRPRGSHTVSNFFTTTNTALTARLESYLRENVDHVYFGMPTVGDGSAKRFYEGQDLGWVGMEREFDVRRKVSDDILAEAVLGEIEEEAEGGVQLVLLSGPAGNGKTISLRRAAWDAAHDYEKFILYIREDGAINPDFLSELFEKTNRRIFVFVDKAALHVDEILSVLKQAKADNRSLTIVTAERKHEWLTYCAELEDHLSSEHEIRYLNDREIHGLLGKLDEHQCLGVMSEKSYDDRFTAFHDFAGRQLLVALHELTSGKPFEVILKDEYDRISPNEAKYLYLDICTMNNFAVPARAGTISRISNVSFHRFAESLSEALDNVVFANFNQRTREYEYNTRHYHIAKIVFDTVLENPELKFNQLIRIMSGLNLDYSTDAVAFREIIKSGRIVDAFPSVELGHRFYDRAIKVTSGSNASVYQQAAIFELNHKGGTFGRAQQLVNKAVELSPHDRTIQHTLANLKRRQALEARTALERATYRKDARKILSNLKSKPDNRPYEFHTAAQIEIDELSEAMEEYSSVEGEDQTLERRISELIAIAENSLEVANQRFPENSDLLSLQARFLTLISEDDKAVAALKKAIASNPRQEFIAVALARLMLERGDRDGSLAVLNKCVEANPSAKYAHLEVAKVLMRDSNSNPSLILSHLRRSTTRGDTNYTAKYHLARQMMITGDEEEALSLFEELENAPMTKRSQQQIRDRWLDKNRKSRNFIGIVGSLKGNYCFVNVPDMTKSVFAHSSNSSSDEWKKLRVGAQVEFSIGFTMSGLTAINLNAL